MKILLIGASGQVGRHLKYHLQSFGRVIAPTRNALDLENVNSIRNCFEKVRPKLIVNAAGWTNVDKAEIERERCKRVNVDAIEVLAEETKKLDAFLVHYSTDYVFSGNSLEPYKEEDEVEPLNYYGETKLQSEKILLESDVLALVFRISWIYDTKGNNFLLKMIEQSRNKSEVSVVGDQYGTPNSAYSIANYTHQVLSSKKKMRYLFMSHKGLYHLVSDGYTSWYNFAVKIMQSIPKEKRTTSVIKYLSSFQYESKVDRPMYSVLDNRKARKAFNLQTLDWQEVFQRDVRLR